MKTTKVHTGIRLDLLPIPTSEEIHKVRQPFDRTYSDDSPFEELVLAIRSSLRKLDENLKKADEYVVIAKLINRLKSEELSKYEDDEDVLLEEARKFLASDGGIKWVRSWFVKEESARRLAKAAAKALGKASSPSCIVSVTPAPSNGDNPEAAPKQVNGTAGEDLLQVPPASERLISQSSRVGGITAPSPVAHSSLPGPVLQSSASSSRVRRASDAGAAAEMICQICGQDHLGMLVILTQLLGSSSHLVRLVEVDFKHDRRIYHLDLGQHGTMTRNDPSTSIIIVIEGVLSPISFRVPERLRSNKYIVVAFLIALCILALLSAIFYIIPFIIG